MSWRLVLKRQVATLHLPPAGRDAILFTFDDGPHPEGTPAVLDVLRRYGARGVFFVVGSRAARAPDLLRRVVAEGHALGNHSYEHPNGRQFGLSACRRDLERCQDLVIQHAGYRPRLFRPPLGHLSVASLVAPRLVGLTPVLWSVDSDDWRLRSAADVQAAADRLLEQLTGRRLREIVLCHDEQRWTADLLDRVLPRLVERGVNLRPTLDRAA